MKKVLVLGGGGREHAIVDALSRSPQVGKIYCAPGNAGIALQAECLPLKETQVEQLKEFALENGIDLTAHVTEANAYPESGLQMESTFVSANSSPQ